MSKKETPLTRKYWEKIGGTLIEEFVLIPKGKNNSIRLIDAVIILNEENKISKEKSVSLEGKEIIAIQTKAKRLGMYLMGQVIFSEKLLLKYHKPKTVKSVALCTQDDEVLRSLLTEYPNVEVVVLEK